VTHLIQEADAGTSVLLVHAPYPGRLKFDGEPSSLLHAVTPAVLRLAALGEAGRVGLLDPGESSPGFYSRLEALLRAGSVRVVAISTSTAAIEETARIVALVREAAGPSVLVLVGGPHEDDCEVKCAEAIPGIDLSIGGDAEHLLGHVIPAFLAEDRDPGDFCHGLPDQLVRVQGLGGRGTLASRWWPGPAVRPIDLGRLAIGSLPPRCRPTRPVRFRVFQSPRTIPVMVSRGCAYGQCTFCAEGIGAERASVLTEFSWVGDIIAANPGAALYFQDSIFPNTRAVTTGLLPLLRDRDVEWGCQVYLPMLSRRMVKALASHGCRYLYTGIESGSEDILRAVGKSGLTRELLLERLGWIRDAGMRLGLSVMFGAMDDRGATIETEASIAATVALCRNIVALDVDVAGFYPNVETVLPGTQLALALAASGVPLDWYRPRRTPEFAELEDGAVGHNAWTVPTPTSPGELRRLAEATRRASATLLGLGRSTW